MKEIKWGVLGCGGIANSFAKGLRALEHGQLLAAGARTPGKAEAFAEKYGVERVYSDYESLVADPDIDIIYVATTHNFHFENAKLCLENGKHVVCEKPFTINATQFEELTELARANNLFMMEAFWTRFLPAYAKLREVLADGVIGEVMTAHANFNVGVDVDNNHRLKNKALAGGALLDLGVYPLNFAAIVFGEHPTKVTSSATMGETGVDYSSYYHLEYAGGQRAVLSSSFIEYGPSDALVFGTKGYIRMPPTFLGATSFTIQRKDEEPEVLEFPSPHTELFKYEIAEAMECVAAGKKESDVMPLSETLSILKTMDAMRAEWGLKYEGE